MECFLVYYSYNNSCFLKKDWRFDIRFVECGKCWFRTLSQDRKNSHIFICFSHYFIYSDVPDLALVILKKLIPLFFCDILQKQSNNLLLVLYDLHRVCQYKCTRQSLSPPASTTEALENFKKMKSGRGIPAWYRGEQRFFYVQLGVRGCYSKYFLIISISFVHKHFDLNNRNQ